MRHQLSPNSLESFELLLANLKQEEARIESTQSLLSDLSSMEYDEGQIRMRIDTAQSLAAALQKDREVIVEGLSQQLGIRSDKMNLTALAVFCPPSIRPRIFAAKQSLSRAVSRSRRTALSAAVLVNESLRLQQMVLSSLMGISASDRYDAYGSQPLDTGGTRMESRS